MCTDVWLPRRKSAYIFINFSLLCTLILLVLANILSYKSAFFILEVLNVNNSQFYSGSLVMKGRK